jgi:hypothetical protein
MIDPPDKYTYCPLCGAGLTVTGTDPAGWVVVCMFGHKAIYTDKEMTIGPPGQDRTETGHTGKPRG